ncbi:hypothetical protein RHD99_05425 [Buttiauxella selenatireducens]|uniref:Uncharacterized protein n=1 Tax=Buttiauxella selenatireducens TaxID=3073902 RepID=A0ABY9SE34_9ENTR|nr:hypothetical protein [Buttiauxella sp. R73]WMY75401.1 hypothetical protein RHD99_05425 [Buttiauxella sp. R73]
MIYLLEDETFVELDDWQKVCKRASYLSNLNVANKKLEKIIGYYELPNKVSCGLSNCHTPHFKGYVVETDDGSETNIGHACGTKYFDVVFEQMSSDFINALEVAKARAFIHENKKNVFGFWQDVNALSVGKKNIRWAIDLYKKINDSEFIGLAAYRALRQMLAISSGNVINSRPPTQKEIELAQVSGQPIPQSVDIIVGFISYIEFLSPDNDLENIYEKQLRGSVQSLQDADPEKLSRTQMKPIVSGINSLKNNITKASELIEIARLFFTKENLSELLKGLKDNKNIGQADIRRYEEFIESL